MNCVHNELCVVTRACFRSEVLGLMCTTLYLAPRAEFTLPDGHRSYGTKSDAPMWVVKFENMVRCPIGDGVKITGYRLSRYGVLPDYPFDDFMSQARGWLWWVKWASVAIGGSLLLALIIYTSSK